MRVTLVGPDHEDNLSVRYLASSLEAAGHRAKLAAFNCVDDIPDVVAAACGSDIVGLSMVYQVRAKEYLALAEALKRSGAPWVIAGGHFATCAADQLMRDYPALDLIVLHEGERTLVELANSGNVPRRLAEIEGIVYRQGERVSRTPYRPTVEDLDQLPPPDRRGPVTAVASVPTAVIMGSRGCLMSCDYCAITTLHRLVPGRRFRQRSPEDVADEMAALYHRRGVRQFIFHDDNFLVTRVDDNHRRLDQLDGALRARNVGRHALVIKCRPGDAHREIMVRLRDSGLVRVFFGIESSNDDGLVALGRRQTASRAEEALELCSELGISCQYTIMTFRPGATRASLRRDVEFMRRHHRHPLNFCRVELYAGTPLERRMLDAGLAEGSYLGRSYRLEDPAADAARRIATRLFFERCWSSGSSIQRAIGADHAATLAARTYRNPRVAALRDEVYAWRDRLNLESLAQLDALIELCARDTSLTDPGVLRELRALADLEAESRERLDRDGAALTHRLERLCRELVGFDASTGRPRPVRARGMALHAAAVVLAVATGGLTEACFGGVSEYAAPPLEDADSDGLPDECERSVFGTDAMRADSDGDGVADGDEDHDGDGLTNAEEQSVIGEYDCDDVTGGDADTGGD